MAKTAKMRLIELIILKDDIADVIEYLGKNKNFELRSESADEGEINNFAQTYFENLQVVRSFLQIPDVEEIDSSLGQATKDDEKDADFIIDAVLEMQKRKEDAEEALKKTEQALAESQAFANLQASYGELEHLSFLSMRIGKIDRNDFDSLRFELSPSAVVVPLGDDNSRIMAATTKKNRFAMDAALKKFNFSPIEISADFVGVPDGVIDGMKAQVDSLKGQIAEFESEKNNFSSTMREKILLLLQKFSISAQVQHISNFFGSTQSACQISGWISAADCDKFVADLDKITKGRCAMHQYEPDEIPEIRSGREKVPVKFKHGKFVSGFEGIIFSYGCPLYGTIDPTPIVAFFFTLLFGIMFGDCGQGLVFLLLGILLATKAVKIGKWNRFAPVFIAIGTSSSIMGLLTGEFFGNDVILRPFSRAVTGLFGQSRDHILHLMPSADTMGKLFAFLGFTLTVGFVINSIGLIVNIANQFSLKRLGRALFGKTGLSGAAFFWLVAAFAVRALFFGKSVGKIEISAVCVALAGVFFASPLECLVEKRRPVFENGVGAAIIEGLVEILETVSSYLSNSVSFLRVGAFALAHAVLGFIIFTLQAMVQNSSVAGGIAVAVIGNAVVILLEGMIVAIQVMRLQYYEFFSKFFLETGREFAPFEFKYKTRK